LFAAAADARQAAPPMSRDAADPADAAASADAAKMPNPRDAR